MNIHYDVTCLLTAVWRSHSGQIVWAAWINCELAREEEGGGWFWTHSTYTGYPGSAGSRQLDRWRCLSAIIYFHMPNILQTVIDGWTITIKQNVRFRGRMHPESFNHIENDRQSAIIYLDWADIG